MPALPTDILDRIKRIEDTLQRIAGRVNIRPALDLVIDGLVRIGSGGTLRVDHITSVAALYLGDIFYPYTTGAAQRGTIIRGDNGQIALGVYAYGAALPDSPDPDVQRVHIRDPNGVSVLLTHPSGGLERPHLAIGGWQRVRNTEWSSTTSATFEGLYGTSLPRLHPMLIARVGVSGLAGGTAMARLVLDGVPIGNTVSASSGVQIDYIIADVDSIPLHTEMVLTLEVRRTNGTGSAAATVFGCWGTG